MTSRRSTRARLSTVIVGSAGLALVAGLTAPAAPAAPTGAGADAAAVTGTTAAARQDIPARPPITVPGQYVGMHGMGPSSPSAGAVAGSFRIPESEWARVETKRGTYYWDALDDVIAQARARGAQDVLMVLGRIPEWAADMDNPRGAVPDVGSRPPRNLDDWDNWIKAIATRYRGNGFAYQVLNEANLSTFWVGGPELAAELTARTYRIVKRIDPGATVVAASTTLRLQPAFRAFYPRYLAALRNLGWPLDVFSVHTYPASTGTPATRRSLIRGYLEVLRAAGAPDLPIWDTEVNYGLGGPGPAYPEQDITGRKAATWVARTYVDSLRLGITRTYWYSQLPPDDFLGIQMWTGTPGLAAERWAQRFLPGRVFDGCTTAKRVTRCRLRGPEGTAWIAWATGRGSRTTVPTGATTRCAANGRCRQVVPGRTTRVTALPVRLGPPTDS